MSSHPWLVDYRRVSERVTEFQQTMDAVAEVINRRPNPFTEMVRNHQEIQRLAQVAATVHLNATRAKP